MIMKVLAVASCVGHWEELYRIVKPLEDLFEICYVSTRKDYATLVEGKDFYTINDFNKNHCAKMLPAFFQAIQILLKVKPQVVITTGAAPGLIMVFVAALLGKHTIWVDSMANVQHLSLSGRIAQYFVSRIYTQWSNLANKRIKYAGNVLG